MLLAVRALYVSQKMKGSKIFIAAFLWIASLAITSIVSSRMIANKVRNHYDPLSLEEIVNFGNGWQYLLALNYLDGGSWDLGFLDTSGNFVFLRINYSLNEDHKYRKFYLSKSLKGNREFLEIKQGSKLESQVIDLIQGSRYLHDQERNSFPDKSIIVELLKTRDLGIIISPP
jgi:hypothetical protein